MFVHGRGCEGLQGVIRLTMPVNLLLQMTGLPAGISIIGNIRGPIYHKRAALEGFFFCTLHVPNFRISPPLSQFMLIFIRNSTELKPVCKQCASNLHWLEIWQTIASAMFILRALASSTECRHCYEGYYFHIFYYNQIY
uniref:Uncharacterized protein n=1 Tax=Glossina palpalis gambiensis TaxID=67801 RepID=A0A1B0B2J3_9MUSC